MTQFDEKVSKFLDVAENALVTAVQNRGTLAGAKVALNRSWRPNFVCEMMHFS